MAERDHMIALRSARPGYEHDYAAWLAAQIELMKAARWSELDHEHLIDEVESLGRSEFSSFVSAIEIVLVHMLKCDVQPGRRSQSWVASIEEHRRRIVRSLSDNPSYRARLDDAFDRAFDTAMPKAAGETNLPLSAYPPANPYSWQDMMSREHRLPD